MDIETAISIALSAHTGQKDKYEEPYILHPLQVMNCVHTEGAMVVAVLHDVVEDTVKPILQTVMFCAFCERKEVNTASPLAPPP